ncbi:MAG: nickel-dependent lactate racemase, partial [Candidatus Cloacimonetes bacterium]|nr:nickel-dependent lactate racemase [Candidatus Cloacimonadota bacterium]
ELEKYWSGMKINFIVACGSHRKPTEKELDRIFGPLREKYRDQIHIHDALNSPVTYLGTTRRGTPVEVNRLAVISDRIIAINSVEPHYFAGFTGGRKSILPGISSYRTIETNHKMALDKKAGILVLDDNPVHEDMSEAAALIKSRIFAVNVVMTADSGIHSLHTGNIFDSFLEATAVAGRTCTGTVPRAAEIVISVVREPVNKNLYQAQKGIENSRAVLKEGGIMILVAECEEGIGMPEFYDLLSSCSSPEKVFERIEKGYVLGYHKAAKMADFISKNRLWMVTSLSRSILEKIFITKARENLQEVLDKALAEVGRNAGVILNLNAGMTTASLDKA